MVRALPCHGRGYGFEPRRSRQSSFGAPAESEDCRALRFERYLKTASGRAFAKKRL